MFLLKVMVFSSKYYTEGNIYLIMNKLKRIMALVGVILLIALYVSTIVLAIIGSERALTLLRAAIYCTIIVPILLWAYSFIYRLIKRKE